MYLLIFIASAWGPVNGGINSLNYDLAKACAAGTDVNKKVCCVIPDLSEGAKQEMQELGIIPVTISHNAFGGDEKEAAKLISNEIESNPTLRHYYPRHCSVYCIGHDIYTGMISFALAKLCKGKNIVFHHMDYPSYYLFQNNDVTRYEEKVSRQKDVLKNADLVFAVGPKLYDSAADKVRRKKIKVIEFIPGLSDIEPIEEVKNCFDPIVFGRVEKSNVRIKQTSLAMCAFASAISMDAELPIIGNDPTLTVVGYDNSDPEFLKAEVDRLQEKAENIAKKLCNIVPKPYVTDREELAELISDASVAMMLSFHEGFGLVGMEAIAAGVPLIISENSGLYQYLAKNKMDNLVYKISIQGSTEEDGFSEEDLSNVANALRIIRNKEAQYKNNALELRKNLIGHTWRSVADDFIADIQAQWPEPESTDIFFRPEQLVKLVDAVNEHRYTSLSEDVIKNKKIYRVEGKDALASLYVMLKEHYGDYAVRIYIIDSEGNNENMCSEFQNDCFSYFGTDKDSDGPGFDYVLGERLEKTVLILDNFYRDEDKFTEILKILAHSKYDFYLFLVNESDASPDIKAYDFSSVSKTSGSKPEEEKSAQEELTDELRTIYTALCLRNKKEYSKGLIRYVCCETNRYCESIGYPADFFDVSTIEDRLLEYGLIEDFTSNCYQNCSKFVEAFSRNPEKNDILAYTFYSMGKFYARDYNYKKNRTPQLESAYFSCRCFDRAIVASANIRDIVKGDYEKIITNMRKNAMDSADYRRFISVIRQYLEYYGNPDNPWIWYTLYHCESLCEPSSEILTGVRRVLDEEIPGYKDPITMGDELFVQLTRLCVECENELGLDRSWDRLLYMIENADDRIRNTTAWDQGMSTLISVSILKKDYATASGLLEEYKKKISPYNTYPLVISIAFETELILAGKKIDASEIQRILPQIKKAYFASRNRLRDFRAQGWTLGLWGECQIALGDDKGNGTIFRAMKWKSKAGENTNSYRNWLKRLLRYHLAYNVYNFLNKEIDRTKL